MSVWRNFFLKVFHQIFLLLWLRCRGSVTGVGTQQQVGLTIFVKDTMTGIGPSQGIQPLPFSWRLTSVTPAGHPAALPNPPTPLLASDLHPAFPPSK